MSDFTPNLMARSSRPPARLAVATIWWGASILTHVVALAWLWTIPLPRPGDATSGYRVSFRRSQQVMRQVHDRQVAALTGKVRDLQCTRQKLATLEARKLEEYAKHNPDSGNNPLARIEDKQTQAALMRIDQAQATAARLQAEVLAAKANSASAPAAAWPNAAQQQELAAVQKLVAEAQQRAAGELAARDGHFTAAYKAQAKANALQESAAKAQQEFADAVAGGADRPPGKPGSTSGRTASGNPVGADSAAEMASRQARAAELQSLARTAQEQASAAFQASRSSRAPAHDNGQSRASSELAAVHQSPGDKELGKMTLPELFDAALQVEAATAESYRRLRAIELALIQRIPLDRAMDLTDTARTARRNPANALAGAPDLEAEVRAGHEVGEELVSMQQLTASMLAQAHELDRNGSRGEVGARVSTESVTAAAERAQQLAALAGEDGARRSKDLSALMRAAAGPDQRSSIPDGGRGPRRVAASVEAADVAAAKIKPLPGRVVSVRGDAPQWMFVDSWYVLGPFENAMNGNIDRKFPPETIVDLNGVYEGRHGCLIRWEFTQSGAPNVRPLFRAYSAQFPGPFYSEAHKGEGSGEYIIYYAYTELRFEQDCDLWVALGSDDYGCVWVNDQMIWAGRKFDNPWKINQGLRKVHFRAGINRILYRIGNGWGPTEFSFVVGNAFAPRAN